MEGLVQVLVLVPVLVPVPVLGGAQCELFCLLWDPVSTEGWL